MGNKILEYKIIYNYGLEAITTEMNRLIEEGWQPFGAPYFVHGFDQYRIPRIELAAQAVVKYMTDK
jgi:hypothetical protein